MRVLTMSEQETNVEETKAGGAVAEPRAPKSLEEARKDVKALVRKLGGGNCEGFD